MLGQGEQTRASTPHQLAKQHKFESSHGSARELEASAPAPASSIAASQNIAIILQTMSDQLWLDVEGWTEAMEGGGFTRALSRSAAGVSPAFDWF
jgi:hypothetical protein